MNIGGLWGTITDRGWDIYDATVVCKQLQFGGAVGAYTGSAFGNGNGPVWMSDFECKGNEDSLAKCNHSNTEVQGTWDHYSDASVECFGESLYPVCSINIIIVLVNLIILFLAQFGHHNFVITNFTKFVFSSICCCDLFLL